MAKLTRRGLIRQTTIGTAAAAAVVIAPGRMFAHSGTPASTSMTRRPDHAPTAPREPLGAYVHDFTTGEITLMVGTRELKVRDPDLVRRLLQAAR